jgi:hypothetical protein
MINFQSSHTPFRTFSIVTTKLKTLKHKKHNASEEASSFLRSYRTVGPEEGRSVCSESHTATVKHSAAELAVFLTRMNEQQIQIVFLKLTRKFCWKSRRAETAWDPRAEMER